MRRMNAILSMLILALFLLHGVLGAFQMFGVGSATMKGLACAMLVLIGVHALLGIRLTFDSVRIWRRTGAGYFKQNRLFWARRLSGLAVMLLIGFHVTAFSYTVDGAFRLRWFDAFRLTTQILLVASIAAHVITNVRPALIALGIRRLKPRAADLLFILSAMLVVMAVSFIIYYIRWNAA